MTNEAEIQRCATEIASALAYDGQDWLGALLGWADWSVEKQMIEEGRVPS